MRTPILYGLFIRDFFFFMSTLFYFLFNVRKTSLVNDHCEKSIGACDTRVNTYRYTQESMYRKIFTVLCTFLFFFFFSKKTYREGELRFFFTYFYSFVPDNNIIKALKQKKSSENTAGALDL